MNTQPHSKVETSTDGGVGYLPSLAEDGHPSSMVFQIGFNQCGNELIAQVLNLLGRRVVNWDHGNVATRMLENWKNQDRLLRGYDDDHDAFVDMENVNENLYAHVLFFRTLDQQYPQSKFVLNTSDVETWIDRRRCAGTYLDRAMRASGCATEEAMVGKWRTMWHQHMNDVTRYFKDREDDLCIFHVDRDNPQVLIEFLDPSYRDLFWHVLYSPTVERCGVLWDATYAFSREDILRMTAEKPLGTVVVVFIHAQYRTLVHEVASFWETYPILHYDDDSLACVAKEYDVRSLYVPMALAPGVSATFRASPSPFVKDIRIVASVPHG